MRSELYFESDQSIMALESKVACYQISIKFCLICDEIAIADIQRIPAVNRYVHPGTDLVCKTVS